MNIVLNLKGIYHKILKTNFDFKVEKNRLEETIKVFPKWQISQIESEINAFKRDSFKNYNSSSIDKTIKALREADLIDKAFLVKITIRDNKIKYENFLKNKFHPRFIKFQNFMNRILNLLILPNAVFLFSIADSIDELKILNLIESPVFCISKKSGNNKLILFPHIEWMSKNDDFIEMLCKADLHHLWGDKINKAFWRGTDTGYNDLKKNERCKIVRIATEYPDLIDAKFTSICQNEDLKALTKLISNKPINPFDQLMYKYLLAIDGNAFPGSFFWQLFSNSVIVKNKSQYLEWYYSGLKRNVHYIEYDDDGDLIEKLKYLKTNDNLAQEVSENAKLFSKSYLSNESVISYVYHLLYKYSQEFN